MLQKVKTEIFFKYLLIEISKFQRRRDYTLFLALAVCNDLVNYLIAPSCNKLVKKSEYLMYNCGVNLRILFIQKNKLTLTVSRYN